MQIFQKRFSILCPDTVSRNLSVPQNLPKPSLNLPNRHKKSNRPKQFKNKKSQKLLNWSQKSQTGNAVSYFNLGVETVAARRWRHM